MPKPQRRTHSRYAAEAAELLGKLIRIARIERKLSAQELATRAGISRALLQRIEKGDLSCSLGAYFEVASIVDIPLFYENQGVLRAEILAKTEKLSLLPKAARLPRVEVNDDF